jgi:phenylacetate-CoA ligase
MAGFIQDKIYPNLPLFVQNIAISIYGYKWHKRRFGGLFKEELVKYIDREKFNTIQWEEFQTKELRNILTHAFQYVPFYQQSFKNAGFHLNDFDNFELNEMMKIPYLEKNDLRIHGKGNLLSSVKEENGEFFSSSGSTGTPTQILFSKAMHQRWSAAFEARGRNWAGLSIKNPRGMIGGRRIISEGDAKKGPYFRYNLVEKQVYFSAYHINAENAQGYLNGMLKHHVDYMTGYAMSNFILARFIQEKGLRAPKLKAIITSSEKLTREMRDTFREVYGCKTYDTYSGLEACGLVTECEFGKLHMSPDVGIIELIKDNGEYAQPGEIGEAICTGFLNYDQPLIRYRIGDLLKLSLDQTCDCSRHMPIVDEIIGRVEDTVIGMDGREMVRFHGIFINMPKIVEGQIIQHTLKEFEIVFVATDKLVDYEKDELFRRMQSQLGDILLRVTEVDQIPRNRNGKFKAVISHVKRNP